MNSQGRKTTNVHGINLPREQVNRSFPIRYSQRKLGIAATPLCLPSNRRLALNAPQKQNHVKPSLILEGDNASSVTRNTEALHVIKRQSSDVYQHTPPLSRSLCSPRQIPTDKNAAGQPYDEDQLSSQSISRSRCNSLQPLPNNSGLDTRQHHCRHPSQGASNSHDQSQEDEVATRRPYKPRGPASLPELCKRKKFGDNNPIILVNSRQEFVGLRLRQFSLSSGMWVRQRENFPEENVQRVVKLVKDRFKHVLDNASMEKLLRDKMKIFYHQASRARKSQVLKHSNGATSFAQSMHSRVLNGEPTDPITMFDASHKFKKSYGSHL